MSVIINLAQFRKKRNTRECQYCGHENDMQHFPRFCRSCKKPLNRGPNNIA